MDVPEIPGDLLSWWPAICHYDWNKLILTGGCRAVICVMLDMSTKTWKKIKKLRRPRCRHVSVCILQQLFIFGGDTTKRGPQPQGWSASVEYLNIEQENRMWQSATSMPSALAVPKLTSLDTNVYLMGNNNPVLYVFDVLTKAWGQKKPMPQNPGRRFQYSSRQW